MAERLVVSMAGASVDATADWMAALSVADLAVGWAVASVVGWAAWKVGMWAV
jgi:hypothetical protein